jgi:hypothetical protein
MPKTSLINILIGTYSVLPISKEGRGTNIYYIFYTADFPFAVRIGYYRRLVCGVLRDKTVGGSCCWFLHGSAGGLRLAPRKAMPVSQAHCRLLKQLASYK